MLPKNVLYYGREEPLPERKPLAAGWLKLDYEAGRLYSVRLDHFELIQQIGFSLCDRAWQPILPVISNTRIETDRFTFRITFDARHTAGDVDFSWKGSISHEDGVITFSADGTALSTFYYQRLSLCVLYPPLYLSTIAESADGTSKQGHLPNAIAPEPVHHDIRVFSHEIITDLWAEERFLGGRFEMQDRRNWAENAFLVCASPVDPPSPVEIQAGTRLTQSVQMCITGNWGAYTLPLHDPRYVPTFSAERGSRTRLPRLGLSVAKHEHPLSPSDIARLKALHLSHLRVDMFLFDASWEATLRRAAHEAERLGASLEAALYVSDRAEDELKALVDALRRIRPQVWSWYVFHQTEKSSASAQWIRLARPFLKAYDPSALVGGGTPYAFAELNRGRPPAGELDIMCYAVSPQVGGLDVPTLVENLSAQGETVSSARPLMGRIPLAVTPITLRPRSDPVLSNVTTLSASGADLSDVRELQKSLFAAGWTLGSIKYITQGYNVTSFTYYETIGAYGVMDTSGAVYPIYHVLADLVEFADSYLIWTRSDDRRQFEGIALGRDGRMRVIVANLGSRDLAMQVTGLRALAEIRYLDETTITEAIHDPEAFRRQVHERRPTPKGILTLSLKPFGIACIDSR